MKMLVFAGSFNKTATVEDPVTHVYLRLKRPRHGLSPNSGTGLDEYVDDLL